MASTTSAAQKRAAAKKPAPAAVDPLFYESKVIENNLHATTAEGEIVLPLLLKTKAFREMAGSGLNGLEQLITYVVLPAGGKALVNRIEELDISVTQRLASDWFEAIAERQGTSLGESSGS